MGRNLKFLQDKKFQLVIIIIASFLCYLNVFQNEFASDDIGYVINWDAPKHLSNIGKLLTTESVPPDEQGVYRPGKALFLLASHMIWGTNVFGYHLDGILIHVFNSILVYLVVRGLFRSPSSFVPFITALLFGLHPVQTEAISFLTATFDSIGVTFYLAAFWLYVMRGRKLLASLIFATLAFFTYELTLSLPFLLVAYEYCFSKTRLKLPQFMRVSPYFLLAGLYMFVRFLVLGISTRGEYLAGSLYKTQLMMTKVYVLYLKLLLFPLNLSMNHRLAPGVFALNYKAFINLESINSLSILRLDILLYVSILISLIVLAVFLIKRIPVVSFGIAWFFIGLLPVSYVFPQAEVLAERYLYISSIGFCLVLGWFLWKMPKFKFPVRILSTLVIVVLFVGYGSRTYVRNRDFRDTLTMWKIQALQNPDDPITNYKLAKIYFEKGQKEEAIHYFKEALANHDNFWEAHRDLGDVYVALGNIEAARDEYIHATSLNFSLNSAKKVLLNLDLLKSGTASANLVLDKSSLWYHNQDLEFHFPLYWHLEEKGGLIVLRDSDDFLKVEVMSNRKTEIESEQDYISRQKKTFGTVINKGIARIPNSEQAYVTVWSDHEMTTLQFFLFKGNRVVAVVVYPTVSSAKMREFDQILGSIQISND